MKKITGIILSALSVPFFVLIILLIVGMVQTMAGCTDVADVAAAKLPADTDYHNHTADLTHNIVQAKADWIAENGEWQPNLTAETEAYLVAETERMKEDQ